MITKQILIDDVKINFKKSKRAKNISVRIKPFEDVTVIVPRFSSFKNAEYFVYQKLNWIKKTIIKIQKFKKPNTTFDVNKDYATKFHKIRISISNDKFYINRSDEIISLNFPSKTNLKSHNIQSQIKDLIVRVLKEEAKIYLPKRTYSLASQKQIQFQKVSIRNTKTRWGSCSHKNNISLSLHLMKLPYELIDYVILHELAHILVKNHSKEFWETLEKICPNSKELDKKLKNYDLINFYFE